MHTPHPDLPHLTGRAILSDGGLETTLVFHDGLDLPAFAAFPLLDTADGRARLRHYYQRYFALASEAGRGLLLEAPTWRANPDWGTRLGYDAAGLDRINREAIAFLRQLANDATPLPGPVVISGCIGPRGDGYTPDSRMTWQQARDYHQAQVDSLAAASADLVSAYTINTTEEAMGIVAAAHRAAIPCVISFTVETDGHLPSGDSLASAIERVDGTHGGPAYYMINCAHPTHFTQVLADGGPWRERIRGLRANASCLSHAELDAATELDEGDPTDLAQAYEHLRAHLPALAVIGGCCGTDHRHVASISAAFNG